ncbi:MAG: heavy metal-binding domain-containing protein, partial [Cyanobacteria bacterium]|nr:heavy metal-binding domain-containing protein [Cyanobacteriota bacterium]
MNFIKKFIENRKEQSRKDAENAVKQEAAIAALKAGSIFPRAKERIDREKSLGRDFFSSDLSVREYLLCREAQLETIGQVMGSCFYSISLLGLMGRTLGLTQSAYNHDKFISTRGSLIEQSSELVDITAAQLKARRNAVDRMLLEAKELGAHGVIGVRVNATHFN